MNDNAIGLIGLGLVGSALTERLQQAGFSVRGYDIDAEARQKHAAIALPIAIDVVRACRRVILSLPTSDVVRSVLAEVTSELRRGDIIIDTTTGDPDTVAAIGSALAARGVKYVDATIAGSSAQVRGGDVIVMLGGEASAVQACDDLIRAFARRSFHLGPCGAGAKMKLVVNLVLGLNRAVLAEGISFARACGIEPATALAVLMAGPAFSRVMETKGQKMVQRDFEPQARLSQHLKDVRLILEGAAKQGAKTPFSELHRDLLEAIEAAGFGAEDNAAILRAFDSEQTQETPKITT
jgi:3-hydroxyisobutyrate dehydrogenase-like beta-hydroxyacid dehydrogenase